MKKLSYLLLIILFTILLWRCNEAVEPEIIPPKLEYTITITVNGFGTVSKSPDASTYVKGDTVVLSAAPTAGFEFIGWGGDLDKSTTPLPLIVNSNLNVTATFVPVNTYTLMIDSHR